MSQTEQLLNQAQEIARRTFEYPSELAVMKIFDRLAFEVDCSQPETDHGQATRH